MAILIALAPLLFTGKALFTGGVYAPLDILYLGEPYMSVRDSAGMTMVRSPLLSDVVPVLYDGNPAWPEPDVLWKIVEQTGTVFFGASPTYQQILEKQSIVPRERFALSKLKAVMLAGSPVSPECMLWFYRNVKEALWVLTGSGGTDVCTGFTGGVQTLPVYAGEMQARYGFRTVLGVPMLREGEAVGVIALLRNHGRAFAPAEISLAQTFADQAVIAIENVRLFNETKEALERQTATAEILKVISESPTDVQPVFDVIAGRAAPLTGADYGWVFRFDGDLIRNVHKEDLERLGLTIDEGKAKALDNLRALVNNGEDFQDQLSMAASGFGYIVRFGHWLSASCMV